MSASSNGRRPSPSIALERGERDLVRDLERLADDVEVLLWLGFAIIRQGDRTTVHLPGRGAIAQHRLATIREEQRTELVAAMRDLADAIEDDVELVGVPYRCPACGKRERIPESELERAGSGARLCEGTTRRHSPAFLLPDHPTLSRLTNG
jgi:hypothetical protein